MAKTQPTREEIEVECQHPQWVTGPSYNTCAACGAVQTDSSWGIASLEMFASRNHAEYYRAHGRLPDPVPPLSVQRKIMRGFS